jgi:hypothetical protein
MVESIVVYFLDHRSVIVAVADLDPRDHQDYLSLGEAVFSLVNSSHRIVHLGYQPPNQRKIFRD